MLASRYVNRLKDDTYSSVVSIVDNHRNLFRCLPSNSENMCLKLIWVKLDLGVVGLNKGIRLPVDIHYMCDGSWR